MGFTHILSDMREQFFEYDSDIRIDKYLDGILKKLGINGVFERDERITRITFFATDEVKAALVVGVVTNFYKLKTILSVLPFCDSPAFYTLVGATMGVDGEDEVQRISDKATDAVYLNGFCNFCLSDVVESWVNLAEITAKLLNRCNGEDDIYALSIFMMGVDETVSSSIVVDDGLRWEKGGEITVVPYFDDVVKDTVITLVSSRPSDVVVPDKNKVPPEVLTVIHSLGEGNE